MESSFEPAPGGGIVPEGPSTADTGLRRLVVKASAVLPRLPEPVVERLMVRGQRSTRPSKKVVGGTPVAEEVSGGVPCTWLAPELSASGVVVFLHGGSYLGGPVPAQWAWLAEIQRRCGVGATMILYRMPPRHPFPSALDDALAAIRAMRSAGLLSESGWILGGDSAGGGLALATAQAFRDAGDPLPAGLLLTAPWVDIEMEHPDLLAEQRRDLLMGRTVLRWAAERYADGTPLDDPRLSPINGSMRGLPPVHVNVGTVDLFLADNRRLRTALDAAGVPVTFIEQEGATHTYPQKLTTAEAEWTIRSQVRWIRDRLDAEPTK